MEPLSLLSLTVAHDTKSLVSDLVHTRLAGGIPMSAASKDTQLNMWEIATQ